MNTGKIGLNFGEKLAFWMYGKVRELSQNGFTHVFLFLIMCVYCVAGGFIFFVVEGEHFHKINKTNMKAEENLILSISRVCKPTHRLLHDCSVEEQNWRTKQ